MSLMPDNSSLENPYQPPSQACDADATLKKQSQEPAELSDSERQGLWFVAAALPVIVGGIIAWVIGSGQFFVPAPVSIQACAVLIGKIAILAGLAIVASTCLLMVQRLVRAAWQRLLGGEDSWSRPSDFVRGAVNSIGCATVIYSLCQTELRHFTLNYVLMVLAMTVLAEWCGRLLENQESPGDASPS